jgi:membrane protein
MVLRRLRILLARALRAYARDNCSQMAAAISYYVLFSLFPLLIFTVGVLGILLQDSALQEDVIDVVLDNIPLSQDQGRTDVTKAVRDVASAGRGAVGIVGLIGMAWSGSNMFGTIRRSLNIAYKVDRPRPMVRQKLVDLAMVLAFAPFFLVSIAASAALRLAQAASEEVPVLGDAAQNLGFGWTIGLVLVPLGLSFLAFLFLYWVVPAADLRPRNVWVGALVGALLFEVSKVGFGIYLANFSNFDLVFGSLGAVAAFLFWVYIAANVLLFGAEVAAEQPRVMRGDYDAPTDAGAAAGPGLPLGRRLLAFLRGLVLDEEDGRDRGGRQSPP